MEKLGNSTGDEVRIKDPKFSSNINEKDNALIEYFSRIKEAVFTLMSELRPERAEVSKVAR